MLHNREKLAKNHQRFVSRVINSETIWGLNTGNGFASCNASDDADRNVIMFWSDRAYASRAKQGGFTDCTVASVTLFNFLFRWLPGMQNDRALAGTNWTGDLAGLEIEPTTLQDQLLRQIPEAMASSFRAEIQNLTDTPNAG